MSERICKVRSPGQLRSGLAQDADLRLQDPCVPDPRVLHEPGPRDCGNGSRRWLTANRS